MCRAIAIYTYYSKKKTKILKKKSQKYSSFRRIRRVSGTAHKVCGVILFIFLYFFFQKCPHSAEIRRVSGETRISAEGGACVFSWRYSVYLLYQYKSTILGGRWCMCHQLEVLSLLAFLVYKSTDTLRVQSTILGGRWCMCHQLEALSLLALLVQKYRY